LEFNCKERRVIDLYAAFLNRGNEKVFIALALQNGREQFHQRGTPNRRLEIEPGPVGGNAHVEIAAERWIPQVNRRRSFASGLAYRARHAVQSSSRFARALFRLLG